MSQPLGMTYLGTFSQVGLRPGVQEWEQRKTEIPLFGRTKWVDKELGDKDLFHDTQRSSPHVNKRRSIRGRVFDVVSLSRGRSSPDLGAVGKSRETIDSERGRDTEGDE